MRTLLLITLSMLAAACATEPPRGLLGAYQLDDGRTISIRRSADSTLRYRIYETGRSGRLYPEQSNTFVSGPGFANREPVELVVRFATDNKGIGRELEWSMSGTNPQRGIRIGHEQEHWFNSDGARLFGRLQIPDGEPPHATVVLVHGSGDDAATEFYYNADFFVANGFAAFTYDKRGSGRSEGEFTFDFHKLAADAVAAVDYLTALPAIDEDRIGLSGYSQGAWVAPLASSKSDAIRFVIVNFGMIESPAEEARLEMRQLLVDAGVGEPQLSDAGELIRAAVDLVAAGFDAGWPEFSAAKAKYGDADWLRHLDGTPVGQLMSYPKFLVEIIGKRHLPRGLDWHYDSTALLESSNVPMVWLLAAEDRSAPNQQTIKTLQALQDTGKPLRLQVFPQLDHSMLTFKEVDGERIYLGYSAAYFHAEVAAANELSQFRHKQQLASGHHD